MRIQHKGICMWCPLSSTSAIFVCGVQVLDISNLLPLAALRATAIKHNALCVRAEAEEALCVFVLKASIFRAQSGFKSRPLPRLPHAHRGSNFHQLFPRSALASQGPCVEPSGQQSTPCRGSTTVQRPVLTGKKEGAGW